MVPMTTTDRLGFVYYFFGEFIVKTKFKTNLALIVACCMGASFSSFAGTSWDGKSYHADYFWITAYTHKAPIIQKATGLNTSCGPTALLFTDLYFSATKDGKVPEHLKTTEQVRAALKRLYSRLGKSEKSAYTTLDEIATLARGWGWTSVKSRSSSSAVDANMDLLIQDLKEDALALVAVRGGYRLNPVGNFGHIMIVYGYEKRSSGDVLKLFDPYFGGFHEFPRSDVTSSGSKGAFDLVNFAYLKLKR